MNLTEYIASGVLELYVLDRLDADQRREVEDMADRHPEVRAEIATIELSLEQIARKLAPPVDPGVLDRVLDELRPQFAGGTPAAAAPTAPAAPRGVLSFLPWLAVLAALGAAYFFYQQSRDSRAATDAALSQLATLEEECDRGQASLRRAEERLLELTSGATRRVPLASPDGDAAKSAVVFYNPATNRTLFRASQLPPPPAGKQYQLWAIDAGGPRDLGVLDLTLDGNTLVEVDYVADANAFAITLEDEGGKPQPDLTQLQVIGNVG